MLSGGQAGHADWWVGCPCKLVFLNGGQDGSDPRLYMTCILTFGAGWPPWLVGMLAMIFDALHRAILSLARFLLNFCAVVHGVDFLFKT